MKKILSIVLLVSILLIGGCTKADTNNTETTTAAAEVTTQYVPEPYEISVKEFNKHGNVILDTTFDALKAKNIEAADMIVVTIGEKVYEIPVGTAYSDVDSGKMIMRFDTDDGKVILAINGGNFAETAEMAIKEAITEEPGYKWNKKIEKVTVVLSVKEGYKDEYTIRHLTRTNERSDYATLSDAEFANCRAINLAGMKQNFLYRGTTPLDNSMDRADEAMAFIQSAGVKSILNLADFEADMKAFETYSGSFYESCKIINAGMNYDFTSSDFAAKVNECVKFIMQNNGPFYIHCKEGKDRTGVFCAILECLAGASYADICDDYMKTYENFYKVEKGSEAYNIILKTNLEKTLSAMFGVDNLSTADLSAEAFDYLKSTGLFDTEIYELKAKISE